LKKKAQKTCIEDLNVHAIILLKSCLPLVLHLLFTYSIRKLILMKDDYEYIMQQIEQSN